MRTQNLTRSGNIAGQCHSIGEPTELPRKGTQVVKDHCSGCSLAAEPLLSLESGRRVNEDPVKSVSCVESAVWIEPAHRQHPTTSRQLVHLKR